MQSIAFTDREYAHTSKRPNFPSKTHPCHQNRQQNKMQNVDLVLHLTKRYHGVTLPKRIKLFVATK
jgi:hypothetical protein